MASRPILAVAVLTGALLGGCATKQQTAAMMPAPAVEPQRDVAEATAAPAMPPQPFARPAAQVLPLAVNHLQQGRAEDAKAALQALLTGSPDNKAARALLAQIETPKEKLFPAEYFTVQLGKDETLSLLASRYLGDQMSFYALARYNGIAVPAKVLLGQTIKIPKTPHALMVQMERASAVADAASPETTVPPPMASTAGSVPANPPKQIVPLRVQAADPWGAIREDIAARQYASAISIAENAHVKPDRAQAPLLASAYLANAKSMRLSDPAKAGTQAIQAGQLYLEIAGRPEQAVDALEFAVALAPENESARTMLASAKSRTADNYYREGQLAFRKQDLDGALAAWNRTLAIDPDHKNAQVNKAQALELKKALDKIR